MRSRSVVLVALCALMMTPALAVAAEVPEPGTFDLGEARERVGERYVEALAVGLARALGSDGFRHDLYERMQESRYVEGRVALKRALASEPELRRELLWYADLAESWEQIARALPELELYFPSEEHRRTWRGDQEIRVAVVTGEEGVFAVHAPDGSRGTFQATNPPETPTLLLARSEIDYDDLESALVGGKRTGGYLRSLVADNPVKSRVAEAPGLFTPGQVVAKASGVDSSRHTYITSFTIYQDHDPWRGSMEIEIFGSIDGSYGTCQRFTGVEEYYPYFLPAAGATGSKKLAYAVPTGTNVLEVEVWEDDDTGCVVKSSDDFVRYHERDITGYGLSIDALRIETLGTTCGDSLCEGDETRSNCCVDCASCGDGVCGSCESGSSCPADCYVCGNGYCERSKGENEYNCTADCDSCGNGYCEPGEDYFSCPFDCCEEGARICPE